MAPNSQVQDQALEFLLRLDEKDQRLGRLAHVKGLLVTPGDFEGAQYHFPEFFEPKDPFEEARNEDGTLDPDRVDETGLEWATPASPDDDEDLSQWIAAREMGSVSAADFDNQT